MSTADRDRTIVRRAWQRTRLAQEDFARDILECSPRTMRRILAGERAATIHEVRRARQARSAAP